MPSRAHFTPWYSMSAPQRLCVTDDYLCHKQTMFLVTLTSELYPVMSEKLLSPGEGKALIVGGGGHLLSLYQYFHPGSESCTRQPAVRGSRVRTKATGFQHAYYALNMLPLQPGDVSAEHSGHHISRGLARMEAYIGVGCSHLGLHALRMNACWFIKCDVAAAHLYCYCSCLGVNSVSNKVHKLHLLDADKIFQNWSCQKLSPFNL